MSHSLPEHLHFLQRGWLSCNQILVTGGQGPVLIDSGHIGSVDETLQLLHQQGVHPEDLQALVTTHAHIDHFSANTVFREHSEAPLLCGEMTARLFAENDRRSMWISSVEVARWDLDKHPPVQADRLLYPGEKVTLGAWEWEVLSAPGHAPDTLCFFQRDTGVLICADTMMVGDCGAMNVLVWPDAIEKALETLEVYKALPIRIALPGHGEPITSVAENIAKVETLLRGFQAKPARLVQHLLARSFVFLLLTEAGGRSLTRNSAIEMFASLQHTQKYAPMAGTTPEEITTRLLDGFLLRGIIKENRGLLEILVEP